MTRTGRSFPATFRLLATACAALTLTLLAPLASADPTQSGVNQARKSYQQFKRDLKAMNAELAVIEARLVEAANEIDRQQAVIERTTADLLATQSRIDKAQARFDRIHQRLNDRAAEAYMSGPSSNLDLVLGASSLADLSDRLEFVNAMTASDATLAQEVANLGYQLSLDADKLATLRTAQVQQLADAKDKQAQIQADLAKERDIRAQYAQELHEAYQLYKKKKDALDAFNAQQSSGGPHASVPMPAGWEHILQVCPVDQPRAFGDGFGAPRYAGGFHLHAGVDISASYGTPIRAPFDGVARTSYNSLGGNAVYVEGRYGYVYNAHLQSYSAQSNGPVHAGDVIGYVGDTGDATGSPHDHFEFHPYVMPSGWPASAYGYSVIGTAINPYPLLVAACG